MAAALFRLRPGEGPRRLRKVCSAVLPAPVAAAPAAPAAAPRAFSLGERLHGWVCERVEDVHEYACRGYLFRHEGTGAELVSVVQPADENKTFGVVFRTPPATSNGICHVLEHSVLCGSRKYPLKEPFVELMKSSLSTFLNAMTYPDRTCYPVASCNLQDFYNLVDVYLDAVFHPRAVDDPDVLRQEGWHYELERPGDPLVFKGVVFNEMKGVYSNPDAVHGRECMRALFPDNTYGVDSGGDPRVIPDLDFDTLRAFHAKHYHPSNAKFWFYGDDPAEERLRLLGAYLAGFAPIQEGDTRIRTQPRYTSGPRRVVKEYAVGEDEDVSRRTMVTVGWLLADEKPDATREWELQFLNHLLMGTNSSPLRRALSESGLGSRVIGGGMETGLVQPSFEVGLKDVRPDDVGKVEELIEATLAGLWRTGFEEDAVRAAMNTLEFRNRELNTGGLPRGLALLFSAIDSWNYDRDPFDALRFEEPLGALRARLARGERVFEDLIKDLLLDNPHRVTLESRPSRTAGAATEAAERERLRRHKETLTPPQLEGLIAETRRLRELQETPDPPEALAKVPRLRLSDLPAAPTWVPLQVEELGPPGRWPALLTHELPTGGVVYVDVGFDLSGVPMDLMGLVPVFAESLKQLGTARGDFAKLEHRIGMLTGGIRSQTFAAAKRGSDEAVAFLFLRGKAVGPNVGELLALVEEMTLTVDFKNRGRLRQLLMRARSSAESGLVSAGHSKALLRLKSLTTSAGHVNELWDGLSQLETLGRLLKDIDGDGGHLEARLEELQRRVFRRQNMVLNVTCDGEYLRSPGMKSLAAFPDRFPSSEIPGAAGCRDTWRPAAGRASEGIAVPTQVNYVAKGANLYSDEIGYKLHGSSLTCAKLLGTTWLWDRVRVSGGAYGGFCAFDQRSGDLAYLSYRDPNCRETVASYDESGAFLQRHAAEGLSEDELCKAVIGTIGDVDAYQLPDAKGFSSMVRHLLGESDSDRQRLRDEILGTTAEDLKRFGQVLERVASKGRVVVVGSPDRLEQDREVLGLAQVTSPFARPVAVGAKL